MVLLSVFSGDTAVMDIGLLNPTDSSLTAEEIEIADQPTESNLDATGIYVGNFSQGYCQSTVYDTLKRPAAYALYPDYDCFAVITDQTNDQDLQVDRNMVFPQFVGPEITVPESLTQDNGILTQDQQELRIIGAGGNLYKMILKGTTETDDIPVFGNSTFTVPLEIDSTGFVGFGPVVSGIESIICYSNGFEFKTATNSFYFDFDANEVNILNGTAGNILIGDENPITCKLNEAGNILRETNDISQECFAILNVDEVKLTPDFDLVFSTDVSYTTGITGISVH